MTGGSEWTLEDTIELKNISIPDPKTEIDLSLIYNNERNLNDSGTTDSGTVLVSAQLKKLSTDVIITARNEVAAG